MEAGVSLIIPAYNAEDYVVRSIDTALARSFSNLEIIIVDDGSTDATPEIFDWYAGMYANVRAIHQENGGVASARNTGIKQAGGKYIGFMDNDDMLHPDMIARLYHSAEKMAVISHLHLYIRLRTVVMRRLYNIQWKRILLTVEMFFQMHFDKGCMFAVVLK